MKVTIQTPDIKVTRRLSKFVKASIARIANHQGRILEAQVILRMDKSSTQQDKTCELKLVIPGNDLFAIRQGETFEEAVTACIHAMKHQVSRWEDFDDRGKRRGSATTPESIETELGNP